MTSLVSPPARDTSVPAQQSRRTYPLGWLRALAALSVVGFHGYQHQRYGDAWQWPWTGLAHQLMLGTDAFVDMFFVLSGLVLWLPIASALLRGETSRPGRVLLYRRMARLLPLYLTVVLLVWTLTNHATPGHWVDLLTHLTFTHVYSDDYIFWTNGPAWSLAVEFHFYLLMALSVPVLNRLVRRCRTPRARLVLVWALPAALVLTGVLYLAWATTLSGAPHDDWSTWFNPVAKAGDFGIGMALATLAALGVRLSRPARVASLLLGLGGLLLLVLTRPVDTVASEWWHPAYALVVALALAPVVLHDGASPRWMSWGPVVWLGGLGYGIYLVHEPVMRCLGWLGLLPEPGPGAGWVVTAAIVAVPSIALAWVSSRTVEAAGLRLLATLRPDGSPRDYYDHLHPDDPGRRAAAGLAADRGASRT